MVNIAFLGLGSEKLFELFLRKRESRVLAGSKACGSF